MLSTDNVIWQEESIEGWQLIVIKAPDTARGFSCATHVGIQLLSSESYQR
jgi:hypothetical protein